MICEIKTITKAAKVMRLGATQLGTYLRRNYAKGDHKRE